MIGTTVLDSKKIENQMVDCRIVTPMQTQWTFTKGQDTLISILYEAILTFVAKCLFIIQSHV